MKSAEENKLDEMISRANVVMLTTVARDGSLRSRPMAVLQKGLDSGCLWFFTDVDSDKNDEVAREQRVNIAYASPRDQSYISMSGVAEVVHDRQKAEMLWSPALSAYFKGGPSDPGLALLRVRIESAEYWDGPGSRVRQIYQFARAILGDERPALGEHGVVSPKK